jgi:hypothetical protein
MWTAGLVSGRAVAACAADGAALADAAGRAAHDATATAVRNPAPQRAERRNRILIALTRAAFHRRNMPSTN